VFVQQQQQLQAMREQHKHMMASCEQEIEHHQEAIRRNKEQIEKYKRLMEKADSKHSDSDSD
jgi:septal ring factor EnvC (AmiA/AmiB activator)